MSRRKGKAHIHVASENDYNCELQENVAYATTPYNKQLSEGCCEIKDEEEEKREEKNTFENGDAIELEPASPQVPFRQYLLEKEV